MAQSSKVWIMHIPVVDTSHVRGTTFAEFEAAAAGENGHDGCAGMACFRMGDGQDGMLVWIGATPAEMQSNVASARDAGLDDLASVIEWAMSVGATHYIRFCEYGDAVPALAEYDWEE